MMKTWSASETQKVMVNGLYYTWRLVASLELPGSILEPLLVNIVIRDTEEVTEHALTSCADSKVGRINQYVFSSQADFQTPEWAGEMG